MTLRRVDTVFRHKQLDHFQDLFDTFPEIVEDAAETTFLRFKDKLLDELRHTPEPRTYPGDYPLEWTSELQRRAYFATNGFGAGIPYTRTGALSQGWRARVVNRPDRTLIEASNRRDYAPFVVGRLRTRGQDPQQRFHRVTGWQPVSPTIAAWSQAFADEFSLQYRRLLGERD